MSVNLFCFQHLLNSSNNIQTVMNRLIVTKLLTAGLYAPGEKKKKSNKSNNITNILEKCLHRLVSCVLSVK